MVGGEREMEVLPNVEITAFLNTSDLKSTAIDGTNGAGFSLCVLG